MQLCGNRVVVADEFCKCDFPELWAPPIQWTEILCDEGKAPPPSIPPGQLDKKQVPWLNTTAGKMFRLDNKNVGISAQTSCQTF